MAAPQGPVTGAGWSREHTVLAGATNAKKPTPIPPALESPFGLEGRPAESAGVSGAVPLCNYNAPSSSAQSALRPCRMMSTMQNRLHRFDRYEINSAVGGSVMCAKKRGVRRVIVPETKIIQDRSFKRVTV